MTDWTYQFYISDRLERAPDASESLSILREHRSILSAYKTLLLFPLSANRIQAILPESSCCYLSHIINDHPLAPPPPQISADSSSSHSIRIVFIGRRRYLDGLHLFLSSLQYLRSASIVIDIIGLSSDLPFASQAATHTINFHGYLDKSITMQRNIYYELINKADLFVASSKKWAGVSAMFEAMYRRTAVIIPPYAELQHMFGSRLPFGSYIPELTPRAVARCINDLLEVSQDQLANLQNNAHDEAKFHLADKYADNLVRIFECNPH